MSNWHATTRFCYSYDVTILKALRKTVEEIEREHPSIEIQIGTGQLDSFYRAARAAFAKSQLPLLPDLRSGSIEDRSTVWNGYIPSLYGIPIVERPKYEPGSGALIEGSEVRLLLLWQTGLLEIWG